MDVLFKTCVTLEPVKQYMAKLIELLRSVRNLTNISTIHCQVLGMNLEKKFFFIAFYITELLFPQQSELSYLTTLQGTLYTILSSIENFVERVIILHNCPKRRKVT